MRIFGIFLAAALSSLLFPLDQSSNAQTSASPTPERTSALMWDATFIEYRAKTNELESTVTFGVTNGSSGEVVVRHLIPSCGCTIARMPATPWSLSPGSNGHITVSTDLRGKRGLLNKTIIVSSSAGTDILQVKIVLPDTPLDAEAVRFQMQYSAMIDRLAVFKGDCAACHAIPANDKWGEDLFECAFVICHQPTQRASMVPDLKATPEQSRGYWKNWISYGRVRTLMPAFAKSEGGPLTDAQIASLVDYAMTNLSQMRSK
jgi:hypothetical protein